MPDERDVSLVARAVNEDSSFLKSIEEIIESSSSSALQQEAVP
jgi:hypothetical protein